MTTVNEPPPELLLDDEPPQFTDADLDRMYEWSDASEVAPEVTGDPGPALHWAGPTGPGQFHWAMALYMKAKAQLDALDRVYDQRMRALTDWRDRELKALHRARRDADFFGGHLMAYALAERERTGRATFHAPDGQIKTRRYDREVVVEDRAAALDLIAEYAPDAIKREVLLTPMRKVVSVWDVPVRVVMSPCAEIVELEPDVGNVKAYEVATGMTCPSCGQDALVGQWLETRAVAAVDLGDAPVAIPGLGVAPARVTTQIVTPGEDTAPSDPF